MSNLLEKASIITTPTAYSDGKLHSVKPVQTLGDEEVVNGDFATDSNWSKGTGWSISGGSANFSGGTDANFNQNNIIENGKKYLLEFDLINLIDGGVTVRVGNTNVTDYTLFESKHYALTTISDGTSLMFRSFSNTGGFSIDNVSIKEVIDADFDFQRGSAATRVNAQGLIENVQTLSGNLVQNGDFSEIGSELVTNGDFATDSDWNKGTGWSIINGQAICNGVGTNSLKQSGITTTSKIYKLSFDIISKSNDNFLIISTNFGDTYINGSSTSLGTNTFYIKPTSGTGIRFRVADGTTLTIDNVSVKEVGQNWSFINGTNIGDNKAIISGDGSLAGRIEQSNVFASGKTYKITLDSIINSGGGLNVKYGVAYASNIGSILTTGSYTFYYTASSNQPLIISRKTGGVAYDSSVTNISVIEITDDTDLPRIDYTDGCGSLLLEPQSTNLIDYSEDFSQNTWTKIGSTFTSNAIISPDGTLNADKFIEDTSTGNHNIYSETISVTLGSTYTLSLYVKKGERSRFRLDGGYRLSLDATFDLNTLVVTGNGTIESFSDGWYKLSATGVGEVSSAGTNIHFYILNDSGVQSYEGNGTSGIYIWGAQLEQQSYPTSYIPTNGSTSTRLADVCNNSGSSDLINSTEGVLYAEIASLASTASQSSYLSISDGTYNNRASILFSNGSTNQIRTFLRVGGATQIDVSGNVADVTSFNKVAFSYKENDFKVYINGVLVSSDTNGSVWTADTITKLSFSEINTNAGTFKGNVKALVVFKEALTNDELEGLTGEGYDTFNALALANNYTII